MDLQTLTDFFMWCSIINGGILLLWTFCCIVTPELLYRTQVKWFPIPRETFTVVMYCFIGLFKFGFLFLSVVPFIALLIIK